MATQADRRAATQAAILKAARKLFGDDGFQATTMDDIASAARVAKGAVYHHFKTKEDVFEAVFEEVSRDLVAEIDKVSRCREGRAASPWRPARSIILRRARRGPTGQIILRDGPAVLGWERWREIDAKHFGGKIPRALEAAMERGLLARQPVEPLARLLLGAMTEAAVACAGSSDIRKAGAEYSRAFRSLLEAMRVTRGHFSPPSRSA